MERMTKTAAPSPVAPLRGARTEVAAVAELLADTWTNPGNAGRRGRAVLGVVAGDLRCRLRGRPTQVPIGDASRALIDPRLAGHRPLGARLPDYAEMRVMQRLLRPGDLFVDVGSNVGTYALIATECGADVIAIEAQPEVAALLRHNIELNGRADRVRIVEAAAGDTRGIVGFTGGLGLAGHAVTGTAVLERSLEGHFTKRSSGVIDVVQVRLDDVVGDRAVTLLKLDVEGYEAAVLRGAAALLDRGRIGVVQFENRGLHRTTHGAADDAAAVLADHGASFWRPERDGRVSAVDSPADEAAYDLFGVLDPHLVARRLG